MQRINIYEIRTLIYLMQFNIKRKSILLKREHCNLMQFNKNEIKTLKCNVITFYPEKELETLGK
jgi:hypothetical protein